MRDVGDTTISLASTMAHQQQQEPTHEHLLSIFLQRKQVILLVSWSPTPGHLNKGPIMRKHGGRLEVPSIRVQTRCRERGLGSPRAGHRARAFPSDGKLRPGTRVTSPRNTVLRAQFAVLGAQVAAPKPDDDIAGAFTSCREHVPTGGCGERLEIGSVIL